MVPSSELKEVPFHLNFSLPSSINQHVSLNYALTRFAFLVWLAVSGTSCGPSSANATAPTLALRSQLCPAVQDSPHTVVDSRCVYVHGVDYFGNDVGTVQTNIPSAARCCFLCSQHPKCFAWGWNDGTQDAQYKHMCFFKKSVGNFVANPSVISGSLCKKVPNSLDTVAEAYRTKVCPREISLH